MSENNHDDAGQGGVDWQREINSTLTPMESLRQLAVALERLEAEGVVIGGWVFAVRTEQNGVEFPTSMASRGSSLLLCALADVLARDMSGQAMLHWATAGAPQKRETAG